MVNKVRNDFRVFEETNTKGDTIWRVRVGSKRGAVSISRYNQDEETQSVRPVNIDPWFLGRGQTRADRNA